MVQGEDYGLYAVIVQYKGHRRTTEVKRSQERSKKKEGHTNYTEAEEIDTHYRTTHWQTRGPGSETKTRSGTRGSDMH